MGSAEGEPAGIFLINILRQHAPHIGRRILPVHAGQQNREVANVDQELLLIVKLQLGFRDAGPHDDRPGPVVFAVHDRQQPFEKLCAGQSLVCHALPSFFLTGYNQPPIR